MKGEVLPAQEAITLQSLDGMSLEQLAELANQGHARMIEGVTVAFVHAVRTGQALNAAFVQVPRGQWKQWVEDNCTFSMTNATVVRRIGYYAEELRAAGITSVKAAEKHLTKEGLMLPWVGGHPNAQTNADKKVRAREMRDQGISYQEIADELGLGMTQVWDWLNPEARQKAEAGRRRATSVARRKKRDQALRELGGSAHDGYKAVRSAYAALEQAAQGTEDEKVKKALANAARRLEQCDDELYRAARLAKGGQ